MKKAAIKPEELYSTDIIKNHISDVTIEMLESIENGFCDLCGDMFEDLNTVRAHFLGSLEDHLVLAYPEETADGRSSQDVIRRFGNILHRVYGIGSHIDVDGNLTFTYDGTSFKIHRPYKGECLTLLAELDRDGVKASFFTYARAVGATIVTGCALPQALAKADFIHRRVVAGTMAKKVVDASRKCLASTVSERHRKRGSSI